MNLKEKLNSYTPIENKMNREKNHFEELFLLYTWYHNKGINAADTLKKKIEILTILFERGPDRYATYEYKNGCWEIETDEVEFLFLYSNKGMEILVSEKIDKRKVDLILEYLKSKLF